MQDILIVGGGLHGMIIAYAMIMKNPKVKITLIEKTLALGGLYNSINIDNQGYFDNGMHIYYETGVPEFDSVFWDLKNEVELNYFTGNNRDIAGSFQFGELNELSP